MRISVEHRQSAAWHRAAQLVQSRYRETFDADVLPSPQYFITMSEPPGPATPEPAILACVGFTCTASPNFFSERYLDTPIEEIIASRTGVACARDEVGEIGSLASVSRLAGLELIRFLPLITWSHGKRFVLATVTRRLAGMLLRIGLEHHAVSDSSPSRLHDHEQKQWGRYYNAQPQTGYLSVVAGLQSETCYSFDDLTSDTRETNGGIRAAS
jgi:hypothetical protein